MSDKKKEIQKMNMKINLKLSFKEFYKLFYCLKLELYRELDNCEELGDDPTNCGSVCELADLYTKMLHAQMTAQKVEMFLEEESLKNEIEE